MARKKSGNLTDAELRLMDVLWDRGSATVNDVMEALPQDPPLAYNTVLTTLRILEQKGYVRHTKSSRAFVFEPVLDHRQASSKALRDVLARFFQNSPKMLVLRLLEEQKLDSRQLERLKRMIEESMTEENKGR
ncbi:MAG TPA: BlaI/MecI/CopY family transcriptional regulator [Bryobacteraceae bacterium]|nr:BlaI/MecI/CopY family transcriptional regulator [Bryobacteraceae bacterium]